MKRVIHTLECGNSVGVRGDACSGKTSVLYGAMQMFEKKNKSWNIILIKTEEHLRACYNKEKVLLVIDDILDKNSYMLNHLIDLKNYIDGGFWKVMFSYSNESYEINKCKLIQCSLLDGGHVLNISVVRYTCTNAEKIGILKLHCKRNGYKLQKDDSNKYLELVPAKYFFHYVRSYDDAVECRGKSGMIGLFQNPVKEIVQVLENLKVLNPLGFYILFCCSVRGSEISISGPIMMESSEHDTEVKKWLLGSNVNTDENCSLERMECAVRDVPPEFIESIGNYQYRIKFGCVAKAVQLIILKELNILDSSSNNKLFKHALFLCDFSTIHTLLEGNYNACNFSQLQIHPKNLRHLAERFIFEIQSGHVQRIGNQPIFGNDEFKQKLISQLERGHDNEDIWNIFSRLDKHTKTTLIMFTVKFDKPNHAVIFTNFILKSKKWRKYSRKEGGKVERQFLVLQQNALALTSALQYKDKCACTIIPLRDSVFINVAKIGKWSSYWRDEAIRIVIEVHREIVSEKEEITKEVMRLLQMIETGTHINKDKQSILHLCVVSQNEYILQRVLKHRKAEINQRDNFGQTPLHTAVQENNQEAVKILIKSGAGVEIKDLDGNSPLHLAIHKHKAILDLLIHVNGIDANITDKRGKTPMQLAKKLRKTEHMEILRQADIKDD